MSGMVLDSIAVGPTEAELVSRAVETHPRHFRHGWFEDVQRLFYTLDLSQLETYADRECERERVRRWLDECRRDRRTYAWTSWLQLRDLRP